jgi:hypothetical protein
MLIMNRGAHISGYIKQPTAAPVPGDSGESKHLQVSRGIGIKPQNTICVPELLRVW